MRVAGSEPRRGHAARQRDLAGLELPRPTDAYPDEWFPGIGETDRKRSAPSRPSKLPD